MIEHAASSKLLLRLYLRSDTSTRHYSTEILPKSNRNPSLPWIVCTLLYSHISGLIYIQHSLYRLCVCCVKKALHSFKQPVSLFSLAPQLMHRKQPEKCLQPPTAADDAMYRRGWSYEGAADSLRIQWSYEI